MTRQDVYDLKSIAAMCAAAFVLVLVTTGWVWQ